jgi:hypothetical protein
VLFSTRALVKVRDVAECSGHSRCPQATIAVQGDSMTDKKTADEADRTSALRHLRELIAALDRRVPHIERLGEMAIARDAATLADPISVVGRCGVRHATSVHAAHASARCRGGLMLFGNL